MKPTRLAAAAAAFAALCALPVTGQAQGAAQAQLEAEVAACAMALGYRGQITIAGDTTSEMTNAALEAQQEATAAAINACVQRRAVEPAGPVFPLLADSRLCWRDAPILYRGNLYCFKDR